MKQKVNTDSDKRLRVLLQFKRFERPNSEKWEKFDREFEVKRLSMIIKNEDNFLTKILAVFSNKYFASAIACLCLIFGTTVIMKHKSIDGQYYDSIVKVSESNCDISYACDVMSSHVENYRSIDKAAYLNHKNNGIRYVYDKITNQNNSCALLTCLN